MRASVIAVLGALLAAYSPPQHQARRRGGSKPEAVIRAVTHLFNKRTQAAEARATFAIRLANRALRRKHAAR
jgi:hypothetical protein